MKKIALSAVVIAASAAYVWSQPGRPADPLLADLQTGSIQPQTLTSAGGDTTVTPREVPFVTPAPAPVAPAPAPTFSAAASPTASPSDSGALPPLPAPADSSGFAPVAADAAPAAAPATSAPTAPATSAPTAPVAVADAGLPAAPAPDPAPAQPAAVTVPMPRLRPPYRRVAAAAPTPAPVSAPSSPADPAAAASPLTRIVAATSGLNDGTYRGPVVDAYYGLMQIEAVVHNGRLATIHVLRFPNDRRTSIYINHQALPLLRDEVISAQTANVDIVSGATLSSEAFIQSLGAALGKARV